MSHHKPLSWIPTTYFMQGLPYTMVIMVSVIMYQQFKFSNSAIAFYTSFFLIPWLAKPLIAPWLEHYSTKRRILIFTQYLIAVLFALLALTVKLSFSFGVSWAILFLVAWVAAIQDITSDGLYLLNLSRTEQINWVGMRTIAYQAARFTCQSILLIGAGYLLQKMNLQTAWWWAYILVASLCLILAIYHHTMLPTITKQTLSQRSNVIIILTNFFQLPHVKKLILFFLLYNCGEAQLIKIIPLFLLDKAGAHLSISQVGFVYGGLGIAAMILGIMLSSRLINHFGFKSCLLPFTFIVLLSYLGYFSLAISLHYPLLIIIIIFAQFAFGMSSNAGMVYLMDSVRESSYNMSCYAMGTAIMAFGMFWPGAISGYLQQIFGYFYFFIWIIALQLTITFFIYKEYLC